VRAHLPRQKVRERSRVDVSTGHNTHYLAASCPARHRGGDWCRARAFSDDSRPFYEQTNRGGDLIDRRNERAGDQLADNWKHLRKYATTADSVHKTGDAVDGDRFVRGERGGQRRGGRDLAREHRGARSERANRGGDAARQSSASERDEHCIYIRQIFNDL